MLWQLLFFGWITTEILIAVLTRTRRGQGDVQDRGTMLWLWLVIAVSLTVCGFLEYSLPRSFPHSCREIATALLVIGLVIRWSAVISLGKAFSANVAILESQRINQSGLYKLIRHPSYLGLLLIFFAIGLHALNPVALACAFIPPTAMLLYRIHVEEIALVAAFGHDYESYMARSKRLLPWVY